MRNPFRTVAAWLGRRTQPEPVAAPASFESEAIKAAIVDVARGAYADGVSAERKRIGEIMAVPGASRFAELAVDLAVGGATAAQVAMVISRAEVNVEARLHSTQLESAPSAPTLH